MLMDQDMVKKFLPHRDPFLFIHNVSEVRLPAGLKGRKGPFQTSELTGGTVICNFNVESSLKILEGHFPGHPILPGVVQIEMMAQAASFMMVHILDRPVGEVKLDVALLGVEKAKFRKPIYPGMNLEIHSTLKRVRGPIQTYDAQIFSAGELMSETSVMASIKVL